MAAADSAVLAHTLRCSHRATVSILRSALSHCEVDLPTRRQRTGRCGISAGHAVALEVARRRLRNLALRRARRAHGLGDLPHRAEATGRLPRSVLDERRTRRRVL